MRLTANRCLLLLLLCANGSATAKSVTAVALFNDKAMIIVDESKVKIVRAGQSYKGVTLISSNTDQAVIDINGQQQTLILDGTLVLPESLGAKPSSAYARSITIFENDLGFFEHAGAINGRPLKFLVDTGANLVVLSSDKADKIGLKYQQGVPAFASTASGVSPMYAVSLDEISLGGIVLKNVQAGVIVGSYPEKPLLGMTFLSKVNMNRTGNIMVLSRP